MKTNSQYKNQILNDLKELPVPLQKKIAKMVHVIKKESYKSEEELKAATNRFLKTCGKWSDNRSVEKQVEDIYNNRKSRSGMAQLK